jgi:hypothetical protein
MQARRNLLKSLMKMVSIIKLRPNKDIKINTKNIIAKILKLMVKIKDFSQSESNKNKKINNMIKIKLKAKGESNK